MLETPAVGPIYKAISTTALWETSLYFCKPWLWVVVLYALNLVVPLFKWYLCFARGNITTKVLILGTQVQTWCQGSEQLPISDWMEQGMVLRGVVQREPFPPADCSGSADGVGCLNGSHLPAPREVTSWSSSSGSLLPNGHTHLFGGGLLGMHLFCIAQFPVLGPPWADAAHGQQGLQVLLGDDVVFPPLGQVC